MKRPTMMWFTNALNRVVGFDVKELRDELDAYLKTVPGWRDHVAIWQNKTSYELDYLRERALAQTALVREARDDIEGLRAKLEAARALPAYEAAFSETEPLVSVRIAGYHGPDQLVDIAIASVREQSYSNWELIVVNDGPDERNRRAVESIGDPRIRYEELPVRGPYPEHPHSRWQVAGAAAMNRGVALATGTWIAPLDDDDAFTPDHIEKLVTLARAERAELAYGALIQHNAVNGEDKIIWSSPPAISAFSFQSAIYLRMLDFFSYDVQSWLVGEPGDWNLARRMTAAGIKHAAIRDIVAEVNMVPYDGKADT